MVQVVKITKGFEFFGGLKPGTVTVSTENSKAAVVLARCAVFGPATAEFRLNHYIVGPNAVCSSEQDTRSSSQCNRFLVGRW